MTSTPSPATSGYADKLARELVQSLVAGDRTLAGTTPDEPSPGVTGTRDIAPATPDDVAVATPELSAIIASKMAGAGSDAIPSSRNVPQPSPVAEPAADPTAPTPGDVSTDAQQRFFGSLLQAVLPVVQQVAPLVLQAIQGRRRELGIPEERDPEVLQRDLGEVLSGLLNQIVPALPPIVSQLLDRRDIDSNNTEEVQQRFFFPLLASLIPAAVQALPGIINAVSGGRDLNTTELTSDAEAGERFFGSFLPQLAGGLLQQLPTILQALRPRDVEKVPAGDGQPTPLPDDGEQQQRFFGALVQALLPVVANAVPHLLQAVQGQRRDLGLSEDRDAESAQRDFGAIFNGLLGQVINVLPQIISGFSSQRDIDPNNTEEVQQRFIFPLLAALIPAAAQAIPAVINAVSGGREVNRALDGDPDSQQRVLGGFLRPFITDCFGTLSRPPVLQSLLAAGSRDVEPVADQEEQQRFFGALLPTLLPTLMSAVPSILQAIQGRRRALGMPAENDPEALQRGIFDAISSFVSEATAVIENPSAVLQQVVQDIASVVRDVGQDAAEEQVQQRFIFPLLASLIPVAVQAVPAIISAVSGGRRDLDPAEVLADPEAGQRFFGSLITKLAGGLVQHLPGLLQTLAGGRRDLPALQGAAAADQAQTLDGADGQDRFFGGLLGALVPLVVNAVPAVLQAIQGQRRDLGMPENSDPAALERDIGAILSGLLGQVINVLPQVANLLTQRREIEPRNGEEVQDRFIFPLLGLLIPAAAQAIPAIISAVSGNRDVVDGVVDVADREVAERFFGPLVGQLVSGLVQNLPQILQVFSNRPRDVQLNWINFTGQWLPDNDVVRTVESDLGDPEWVEVQIEQPYGTWWKGVAVWIGGTRVREVGVQDNNRVSDVIRVPTADLVGAGWVQLLKAKLFGVHTGMYAIAGLEQKAGKHITFRWEHS